MNYKVDMKCKGYKRVFNAFDAIAATTKRNEKQQILRDLHPHAEAAAGHVFWLAMGDVRFYLTSKTVPTRKSDTKYKTTDEAVRAFCAVAKQLADGKLSGNAAKTAMGIVFANIRVSHDIHKHTLKYLSAVLDKKLRLGVDTTVTELWDDVVEVFGVPKGIALITQKTGAFDKKAQAMISYPCDSEPKKDGFNISIRVDFENKTAKALSSDNMELPTLQEYADAFLRAALKTDIPKRYRGNNVIIFDSEVESVYSIAVDGKKWKSSWGKTSALLKAGYSKGAWTKKVAAETKQAICDELVFSVYDAYPPSAHTKTFDCPRPVRRKYFSEIAKDAAKQFKGKSVIEPIQYRTCNNFKELQKQHRAYVAAGEEGSIVRMHGQGVIADSRTRNNYVKWKEYTKEDAVILGIIEGNGRNAGRAGAFVCYVPKRKTKTKVTVPTDAARNWVWKHRHEIHGYWLEIVGADDATGNSNDSRNPVCSRFRDDQVPMPLKEVQKLCVKYKLPVPAKDNMSTKLFSTAIAKIAV